MNDASSGIYVLLIFFVSSIFQCTNKANEIETLHEEVMRIHDEVMPKQSALSEAQMEIKKWIARQPDEFQISDDINSKYIALQEAEEAMWEWMNQYSKPSEDNIDAAVAYLNDQKIKISEVREKMLNSLSDYEKIRSQYEF